MPTALQLSPQEWLSYRATPAREGALATVSRRASTEVLIGSTRQLARRIKEEVAAKRVILFGSLARQVDFHSDSDIDLAVEGLHGSQYLEVWRMAEEHFPQYTVELVEIETASESMKQAIEKSGIVL